MLTNAAQSATPLKFRNSHGDYPEAVRLTRAGHDSHKSNSTNAPGRLPFDKSGLDEAAPKQTIRTITLS